MRSGKWLGIVYLAVAASFGAFRGDEVWSGSGIWLIALAPLALAVTVLVIELKRQPSPKVAFILFVMPLVACLFLSAIGLATAWISAERVPRSFDPGVRAVLAAGVVVVFGGLVILLERRSGRARASEAEPDATQPPQ